MLRCALRVACARGLRQGRGRLALHHGVQRVRCSSTPTPSGVTQPVPTMFSTALTLFGGVAVVGVVAGAKGADPKEVQKSLFPYGWHVLVAAVCWPSNLLFMAGMAPSRYESKLWDLKHALERDFRMCRAPDTTTTRPAAHTATTTPTAAATTSNPPATATTESAVVKKEMGLGQKPTWLAAELQDFLVRYSAVTSTYFDGVLCTMLSRNTDGTLRCDAPGKYLYYLRASVDWELIRVQPMRYVWNETETIALYALFLTVGGTAKTFATMNDSERTNIRKSALVRRVTDSHSLRFLHGMFAALAPIPEQAARLPFNDGLLAVLKSVRHEPLSVSLPGIAVGYVRRLLLFVRRLAPVYVWANTINLAVKFSTYKNVKER